MCSTRISAKQFHLDTFDIPHKQNTHTHTRSFNRFYCNQSLMMSIISMFCWNSVPLHSNENDFFFSAAKPKNDKEKKKRHTGRFDSNHGNFLSNSLYHANYTLLCAIPIYKSKVNRQIAKRFFSSSSSLIFRCFSSSFLHIVWATWIFHAPRNRRLSQDLQLWCQYIAFAIACCQLASHCRSNGNVNFHEN